MNQIVPVLLSLAIVVAACTGPAISTSTPAVQAGSTSTSGPTGVLPAENTAGAAATATVIPEPTTAPTPVPASPHWYWAVDLDTAQVIAVNQFGDRHELGALDPADNLSTASISLDDERALLFLDRNDKLRVSLLTPDGMQQIELPADPYYFDTELSQPGRAVIAVHDDQVVISYVTESSTNSMPDTGPILLVNLTSLTAKLIDESVSRDPYSDNRRWFRASGDGRYVRYLNGDQEKTDLRELDLVTGAVRTTYTTTGSSFSIHASPQADLW